jgi:hypothetical protein
MDNKLLLIKLIITTKASDFIAVHCNDLSHYQIDISPDSKKLDTNVELQSILKMIQISCSSFQSQIDFGKRVVL